MSVTAKEGIAQKAPGEPQGSQPQTPPVASPAPQSAVEKKDSQQAAVPPVAGPEKTPQANTEGAKTADAKDEQKQAGQGQGQTQEEDAYKDLKLPEKSFLSEEDLREIKSFAKEKGLTVEVAKLLVERENQAIAGWVGLQKEVLERERKEKWIPALKADPRFGGPKFDDVEASMKKFLERFDPEGEFQKHLESSGLRYFPPLWKMLARASEASARDRILPGQPADVPSSGRRLSNAEVFYGKMSAEKSHV